jgi:hypothetical protein
VPQVTGSREAMTVPNTGTAKTSKVRVTTARKIASQCVCIVSPRAGGVQPVHRLIVKFTI